MHGVEGTSWLALGNSRVGAQERERQARGSKGKPQEETDPKAGLAEKPGCLNGPVTASLSKAPPQRLLGGAQSRLCCGPHLG